MTGIIYHAFDTKTGKSYVGQTWSTLDARRKQHHMPNSTCTAFRDALIERSHDFVWSKLVEVSTQEELNQAELYWGMFFDCVFPNGYCHRLGHSHGKMSEESKKKMSESRKGRPLSASHRLSIALGSIGKKMSLESRAKLAESVRNASDEARKNMSIAASKRKASLDTRLKMSASQKLRRQKEN